VPLADNDFTPRNEESDASEDIREVRVLRPPDNGDKALRLLAGLRVIRPPGSRPIETPPLVARHMTNVSLCPPLLKRDAPYFPADTGTAIALHRHDSVASVRIRTYGVRDALRKYHQWAVGHPLIVGGSNPYSACDIHPQFSAASE